MLVGHSIAHNTESGRAALRRALQLSPPGCPVTARLHPDDCATLGSVADLDEYANRSVNIIEDPALQRGDCVVDADATRIDARIAPALDRLREVIAR